MTVTATPAYTQTPRNVTVQVSTANTNRDGTGTLSSAVAVGANGSLIDFISFKALVTTAAGTLRIFINDGTNTRLLDEVATIGVTPSGSLPSEEHIWTPPGGVPLALPVGYSVYFCTNNAETWNCSVFGGDY